MPDNYVSPESVEFSHNTSERQADWQVIMLINGPTGSSALLEELHQSLSMETAIECHRFEAEANASQTPQHLLQHLETHLPDLIVLDAESLQKHHVDITDWCEHIREHAPGGYRPVVVIVGGNNEQERVTWLMCGADDVLPKTLTSDELRVRILIQLRRTLESLAHPITQVPALSITAKILQRRMNRFKLTPNEPWSLLVISLDHFDAYEEQYGHLAASQVLRAFAAILIRSVIVPDFIGQTDTNDFLVLTHPDKASKIATLLCRQFEAAMPNFYSDRDRKQGYLTSTPDDSVCRRIPLMTLSIGISSSRTQQASSFLAAYHSASSMRDLARQNIGNTWMQAAPQLAGEQTTVGRCDFPILVVESDAAMAFLLKTTLEMDGYPVQTRCTPEEAKRYLQESEENGKPVRLVILDAVLSSDTPDSTKPLSGLMLCQYLKTTFPHAAILCMSSFHQREAVLRAGADVYLPKPFEIRNLFLWVERLVGI